MKKILYTSTLVSVLLFVVFICTSIIAALVDSVFVIIQRCNRPRIVKQINKKNYKH